MVLCIYKIMSATVFEILDCQDWRGERRRKRSWSFCCCRKSTGSSNWNQTSSFTGSRFLRCRRRSTWIRRRGSSNRSQKSSVAGSRFLRCRPRSTRSCRSASLYRSRKSSAARSHFLCWPDQHSGASPLRPKLRIRHQQGGLPDRLVDACLPHLAHRSRNHRRRTGKLSAR